MSLKEGKGEGKEQFNYSEVLVEIHEERTKRFEKSEA